MAEFYLWICADGSTGPQLSQLLLVISSFNALFIINHLFRFALPARVSIGASLTSVLHIKPHPHLLSLCFLCSAQTRAILKAPPEQTRSDLQKLKLKKPKVPPCLHRPNLQVAPEPQTGTETVPLGLKRQPKAHARQAQPPLSPKLTRGALTTLVV